MSVSICSQAKVMEEGSFLTDSKPEREKEDLEIDDEIVSDSDIIVSMDMSTRRRRAVGGWLESMYNYYFLILKYVQLLLLLLTFVVRSIFFM